MLELVYTASDKGLLSGRSGFTTVAMSEGFPQNLITPLENLSGYTNLFAPDSPDARLNPANFSYQQYNSGGCLYHVISRNSYADFSFTGRCNNLAHHIILTTKELLALQGDAAAIVAADDNYPPYTPPPHLLPLRATPHLAPHNPPSAWQRLCGNDAWAQVVAERFRADKSRYTVLQFSPNRTTAQDLLALIAEVSALLTPEERLDFTFSTYCYRSTIGNPICLRAYPEGSVFLDSIKRLNPQSIIVVGQDNPLSDDDRQLLAQAAARAEQQRLTATTPKDRPTTQSPVSPSATDTPKLQPRPRVNSAANATPATDATTSTHSRPIALPDTSPRNRWLPWCAAALVVALNIPLLYVLLKPTVPPSPLSPATAKAPSAPPSPVARPAPSPAASTAATPAPSAAAQPTPTSDTPAPTPLPTEPPAAVRHLRELTPAERLDIYIQLKKKHEKSLALPVAVSPASPLAVTISQIGNVPLATIPDLSQPDKNIFSGNGSCRIPPLKAKKEFTGTTYLIDDQSDHSLVLKISENGKALDIIAPAPNEGLSPQFDNISQITIDGQTVYQKEFSEDFIPVLQKETITIPPTEWKKNALVWPPFQCSDKLKLFNDELVISVQIVNEETQDEKTKNVKISQDQESLREDFTDLFEKLQKRYKLRDNLNELNTCKSSLETDIKKLKDQITTLSQHINNVIKPPENDKDKKKKATPLPPPAITLLTAIADDLYLEPPSKQCLFALLSQFKDAKNDKETENCWQAIITKYDDIKKNLDRLKPLQGNEKSVEYKKLNSLCGEISTLISPIKDNKDFVERKKKIFQLYRVPNEFKNSTKTFNKELTESLPQSCEQLRQDIDQQDISEFTENCRSTLEKRFSVHIIGLKLKTRVDQQ